MFRPAAFFIGLRYTRAKRKNHFISFISLVSMLGIALGVTVLITVLSVMNGFDREIQKRVFSMVPAITVTSTEGTVADWQSVMAFLKKLPHVTQAAPFVSGEVLLNYGSSVQAAMIQGVLPDAESQLTELSQKMIVGKLSDLKPRKFGLILGESLAGVLGATVGDKVTVVTPQISLSPAGITPRYKRFTVVGIFKAGTGFGFDRSIAFLHLNDAQKLMGLTDHVSGIKLNIKNVYAAPEVAHELLMKLNGTAVINTWGDQFGEFFHAVKLEKTMMFFILLLIIAVAAFNLVATLVMIVNDKAADIAILRTFGATPRTIMSIFMVQGGLIGVIGTLLGVLGGLALAWNVTEIVHGIENLFHVQFLSSSVYFVNYLPSEILLSDLIKICCTSLALSFIATLYPAWRAAKVDPVESLRYE